MEKIYEVVSEYWFLQFYRVLKIKTDDKYFLSVDVYRPRYPFNPTSKTCVKDEEYCTLYYEYPVENIGIKGVEKIIVTGVKAKDKTETVNVRWILSIDPDYKLVEEIFYKSWEIIGCKPPSDPFSKECLG